MIKKNLVGFSLIANLFFSGFNLHDNKIKRGEGGGAIIGTIYHSNTIFNLTIPYKESIPAIKSFHGIDAIVEDYPI